MANYIPSPRDWVREQVELYESSGGTKGTTLRDTGLWLARAVTGPIVRIVGNDSPHHASPRQAGKH
jgi:hypothetical protein